MCLALAPYGLRICTVAETCSGGFLATPQREALEGVFFCLLLALPTYPQKVAHQLQL